MLLELFIYLFTRAFALNCGLERDKGYSCDKPEQINFYYEKRLGVCQPMMFHGCGGNENRFTSATECMDKCKYKREQMEVDANNSSLVVDVCHLLTDAKITDVGKVCDNGCPEGYICNKQNKCCPTKEYICHLPASSGREAVAHKHYGRYVYQPGLKNCIRFSYFGSEGNYNNFLSYNVCRDYCMTK